jgi:uncharacterized phiE125 gp8 family phage protein
MKLVTVTAPTEEPVSLTDAKAQVSIIDDTSHDARLLRLIKAARLQAEAHTGMRAMTQTVRLELIRSRPVAAMSAGGKPR